MRILKIFGIFLIRLLGVPTALTFVLRLFDPSTAMLFGTQWTLIFFIFLLIEGIYRLIQESIDFVDKS